MALREAVLKILSKQYEPSSLIERRFGRYDLAFKTDEKGRAVMLFMGRKDENGNIVGERYARRLQLDADGKILKDHWDHKGKATSK